MPVKRRLLDPRVNWQRASSDYARTVINHGSGTPEAREAWIHAKEALKDLVNSEEQVFKDEAEARAAALR